MTEPRKAQASFSADTSTAVVRYQARDVDRAVAFYTQRLGFGLTEVGVEALVFQAAVAGARALCHRPRPSLWSA